MVCQNVKKNVKCISCLLRISYAPVMNVASRPFKPPTNFATTPPFLPPRRHDETGGLWRDATVAALRRFRQISGRKRNANFSVGQRRGSPKHPIYSPRPPLKWEKGLAPSALPLIALLAMD